MNEKMLELLYRSFDDRLSNEEERQLEDALSNSKELAEENEQIVAMRKAIAKSAESSFKPFFSTRVMQRVHAQSWEDEDFLESLAWAFRRVALVGAVAALLLIANNISVDDGSSWDAVLAMPQLSLEDSWELDDLQQEEEL